MLLPLYLVGSLLSFIISFHYVIESDYDKEDILGTSDIVVITCLCLVAALQSWAYIIIFLRIKKNLGLSINNRIKYIISIIKK